MKRWYHWVLYAAVWAALALLGTAEAYLGYMVSEKPVPFIGLLRRHFESWGSWAVVSVGILAYARFLRAWIPRLRRDSRPSTPADPARTDSRWLIAAESRPTGWQKGLWVSAHFLGAAVACALYATAYAALLHGQSSILEPKELEFRKVFTVTFAHSAMFGLFIYWGVVGIEHGLELYRRLRDRERRTADLEGQLAHARLDALRSQLHPHFLFNTLHTISSLIHSRPQTADRIVVRLSELLRVSLDCSSVHEIPLREELEILDRYLEIEQARFGERLVIERAIEPAALEVRVPALILQPLAENAVRHGIEPREAAGHLLIRAQIQPTGLELAVVDNGPGIVRPGDGRMREGIGLSNTRSRLQQLYGDRHRCELNTPPGGGLEVRLLIPSTP